MLREISIFTGTADLELALGLLYRTAAGCKRSSSTRTPLSELAGYFGSETGYAQLGDLALSLGAESETLPTLNHTRQLFRDELLSARALRMHRGRNVYSAGKANLWKHWWLPFRDHLTVDAATLALTNELVSLQTCGHGPGMADCVQLLTDRLRALDFSVEQITAAGHATVLVARRPSRGMRGAMVLYGHYDVAEPDLESWTCDPWTVTERDGRLFGVGIADNKAALAARLVALAGMERTPQLLWVIQGEEEVGSPLAHRVFADILATLRPTLWMEENGYFDDDGTQRFLARSIGPAATPSLPPDSPLDRLLGVLGTRARRYLLDHRVEYRPLNKNFFPSGCPFNNALPENARYLAIGINDPQSGIHRANESVPMWTFPIHARQFADCMEWCDQVASAQGEEMQ